MNLYWERQTGNNCRIHSLNAMFGKKFITDQLFKELCDSYDTLIPGLKSIEMDGFAECRSIVSYIVEKYTNQFTLLIPINLNNINKSNRDFFNYSRYLKYLGTEILQYFEFNKGHIWFNIYKNNKWYKVDSLSGINEINTINNFRDNGYLLVFSKKMIFLEIEYIIDFLKSKNCNEFDENLEIIFYNLYHLMCKIKLDYCKDNSKYNKKIAILRQIYKLLIDFIKINRQLFIDNIRRKEIIEELKNFILFF